VDEVPSKVRVGGYGGYAEKRISRHVEDHVRRHFKHVADEAYDLFKRNNHDYVVLYGSEQNTSEFHHYLHNTLHDRIAAEFTEDMIASTKEILDRVMKIEQEMKQKEEKRLLERLFNQVNSGGLGIVGLDSTIRALQQGQVNFLVVQQGYGKNGFRCTACSSLLINNGSCDYCGGSTQVIPNIVDEAVQQAIGQGCQVKWITLSDPQLSAAGSIGAMLRFRV
jgi:peptide chain release factor subunit 1